MESPSGCLKDRRFEASSRAVEVSSATNLDLNRRLSSKFMALVLQAYAALPGGLLNKLGPPVTKL